jgi:hypothetical protein
MSESSAGAAPLPPEKRLAYFAGTWDYRFEMRPSPFGPGGLVTGTDRDEILTGGFQLLRRYETQGPFGRLEGVEILGWDAELGSYFQRGFDSEGRTHVYRGSVTGDTWTWTFEARAGDRDYRARITICQVSPGEQRYRSEISEDGEDWTTVLEGVLTRRAARDGKRARGSSRRGKGAATRRSPRRL